MTESPWPEFDPCDSCGHPEHDDSEDCEQVTGYGHLTGDKFCGCPGSISHQLDAQRLIGVRMAAEAIGLARQRYRLDGGEFDGGFGAGLQAAEDALSDLEAELLSPSPDNENGTGNGDDSQP